ncbi:MAG: hypothetical protein Q4D54_10080 [Eubacteriales bacterium]|nr:hypothetical protein [Lachnospiraceae bacterium]MDO5128073.1 hypothetical protein [Eubacteriales bacterium]
MVERRQITRIDYDAKGVIVVVDTEEKIAVKVANVSPLGMGVLIPKDAPDILNKDIIIVADCMVMYATVNRVAEYDDTHNLAGIHGKTFDADTLNYLCEHIG